MAYFCTQCVNCADHSKQSAGEYSARDEDGQRFAGEMYLCANKACRINIERQRGEKQCHALEAAGFRVRRPNGGARKRPAAPRASKR